MLALSRAWGKSIVLIKDGEVIARVRPLRMNHQSTQVVLGFECPKDVTILREEIIDRAEEIMDQYKEGATDGCDENRTAANK